MLVGAHGIDDCHTVLLGQSLHLFYRLVSADNQRIQEAGQNTSCVLNSFASRDLQILRPIRDGLGAKFEGGDSERRACARRWTTKINADDFAVQRTRVLILVARHSQASSDEIRQILWA